MRRFHRFSVLLTVAGLAGCATQTPPAAPPPAAPPQLSASLQPPPPAPPPPQPVLTARQPPAVPPLSLTTEPFFTETGLASFYGRAHAGKRTASGDRFDHHDFTAAHRTLAFGTLIRVTNLANGRAVTVEITDRGPHIKSRIIDISLAAAHALHMQKKGVTRVKLEAFREDQPGGGIAGMTAFSGSEAR
jgi:rare lipoprotein A